MSQLADTRIAWVFPSLGENKRQGYPWHSVLSKFTQRFSKTTVFTARFPGFAEGFEDTFVVKVVGDMKYVETGKNASGYNPGVASLSPGIIQHLLRLRPNVVFAGAFSMWTLLVLLLKPIGGWRVVIAYEGSSPSVDYRNSTWRIALRQFMAGMADAFITNNQAGKSYLTDVLSVPADRVFARPYEIATPDLLLKSMGEGSALSLDLKRPVFITVGQVIHRKGIKFLLDACKILKQQGYDSYTVLVAGEGPQREELQAYCEQEQLSDCVHWAGWVDYSHLGSYFQYADVFVFPTLEDTWGMVTLEAMALGKPVLCSKLAGTAEMVVEGENGYTFDPYQPEAIAELMRRFIDNPDQIKSMGEKSQQLMAPHTPDTVSQFFEDVVKFVVANRR